MIRTLIGRAYQLGSRADPYALPASWLHAGDKLILKQCFTFTGSSDMIGGNSGNRIANRDGKSVD